MTFAVKDYLKDLETLVNMDSFSTCPEGTARVADWIRRRLDGAGWQTELISVGDQVGPCLKAVWGNPDHYDVILLGHMDTVFPMGTVKDRPFSIEGDHYKGPGSADMKCGDLFMVYLAEAVSRENLQGNLCLFDHRANQSVSGGNRASQGRTVGQFADAILNDHTGVKGFDILAVCCRNSQSIGNQCHTLHTLHLVHHAQNGGRHMDAIGHAFHRHVIYDIDALHRTLILILTLVVETGHGIIEMSDMSESCIKTSLHVAVVGRCMGNAGQDTLLRTELAKLESSWQLGGCIPSGETGRALHNGDVFIGVGILDPLRALGSCLQGVEVMPLKMQTQDGRFGILHEFGAGFHCLLYHGNGAAAQRGEDAGGSVLHMCIDSHIEGFRRSLLEITSATSMHMNVNKSWYHIHSLGIDDVSSDDGQVTIGNLKDFAVSNDYATIPQPPLWGKYPSIDYLCQHIRILFIKVLSLSSSHTVDHVHDAMAYLLGSFHGGSFAIDTYDGLCV